MSEDGKKGKAGAGRPVGSVRGQYAKVKNAVLADALRECWGIVFLAAQNVGLTREAMQKRIDRTPFLQELIKDIEAKSLDFAEGKMFEAMKKGDMATVRWYLERKGKSRGYATKIDQDLSPETIAAVVRDLKESSGLEGLRRARSQLVGQGEVIPLKTDRA